MQDRTFVVHAHWDGDSGGWWADSEDIPGLVTEADTFEHLVERVAAVAPEIMELNQVAPAGTDVRIIVVAERAATVRVAA